MARDGYVQPKCESSSALRALSSPNLLERVAGESAGRGPKERLSGSKGLRQTLSAGNFFERFHQTSGGDVTVVAGSTPKNPGSELKPADSCAKQQSFSPDQYECINRMLGRATSQSEFQHIRRIAEGDSCLLPKPLRIRIKDTNTMAKRLKRKARGALPSRSKQPEEETVADLEIVRLIELTKAGYQDLQSCKLSSQDSLPLSLPSGSQIAESSFFGAMRESGFLAGDCESDTASTIRASNSSVYSTRGFQSSSNVNVDSSLTNEDSVERHTVHPKADTVERPTSGTAESANGVSVEVGDRDPTTPVKVSKKRSILNLMRVFENPSCAPSRKLSQRELQASAKGKCRAVEKSSVEQPAVRASAASPPVLLAGTQHDGSLSAEVWSKRLSRAMQGYTSADQEKMVGAPPISSAPEAVRSRPWHPAYDSYLSRRLMDESPWVANNAVPRPLNTSVRGASTNRGLHDEGISPMSRLTPRELAMSATICELADTSWGVPKGAPDAMGAQEAPEYRTGAARDSAIEAPADQQTGRLDSSMTGVDGGGASVIKQPKGL